MPDQHGRVAVVTGANSGLGFETTRQLARHGAHVILAVRNIEAGREAVTRISREVPNCDLRLHPLDLASLRSIGELAAELHRSEPRIDILINNAGVMRTPRGLTDDGFERQFGVNFLGHFALTARLLPLLAAAPQARVITVSSTEHKNGRVDFDDLQLATGYRPRKAYQQSKFAETVFGIELDRRLRAADSSVISVLAHPGVSATNLSANGPTGLSRLFVEAMTRMLSQSAERGALPQLYAATAPNVDGGQFFGPSGRGEMRGDVTTVDATAAAKDPRTGRRLWTAAEQLTNLTFDIQPGADSVNR